ncbi:MAG TPA: ATP-grasp domain-containing protein [Candidatus Saccharimonadales bacterium]
MATSSSHQLADDPTKNVVIYINDYYPEYGAAFHKLAEKLGRPLKGVVLVSKALKDSGSNLSDPNGIFKEVVCDFTNDAELRATIKQFENNLLLVSCSAERSQSDFRRVLPHIPYVLGPTETSLLWATHKGKMRELIGAYNSKLVPKVQPVTSADDEEIQKAMNTLTFPMMIKPTGLSEAAFVTKVHDEAELRTALRRVFGALQEAYKRRIGNGAPGVIIEEFMDGEQYSIDCYINQNGKVWCLPLLHGKSAYHMGLEGFHTYQTESFNELTPAEDAAGKQAATDAMHALGLRSSLAHIELFKMNDGSGWRIIELGARPGGMRQEVYEVSYGVDHAFNELLLKTGFDPEINTKPLAHSMIFGIYPDAEGEVVAIEGIDEARLHPSVRKMVQFIKVGSRVLPSTKGGTVMAHGLASHSDVEQLRKDVKHIRSQIKVYIDEPLEERAKPASKKRPHTVA